MSRASKKWEEWKKDPKLKAIAEKKEAEAKAKLDRKMQFNSMKSMLRRSMKEH